MQWVAVVLTGLFALRSLPLWRPDWLAPLAARGLVLLGGLTAVNILSWSGYPWVIWPAGALLLLHLSRRLVSRAD